MTSQGPRRCFEARAVGGKRRTPVPGAALCVCNWFMGERLVDLLPAGIDTDQGQTESRL
jgi:hypothetical protein